MPAIWHTHSLLTGHADGNHAVGTSQLADIPPTTRLYLTPDEAIRLYDEVWEAYEHLLGMGSPYLERKNPKLRPLDAVPVESILLSYPLLDLPALPEGAGDDDEGDSETDPDG